MKVAIIGTGLSGIIAAKNYSSNNKNQVYMINYENKYKNSLKFYSGSPKFFSTDIGSKINDFLLKYKISLNSFTPTSVLSKSGMSEYWGGGIEIPSKRTINIIKRRYGLDISKSFYEIEKLLNTLNDYKINNKLKFYSKEIRFKNLPLSLTKSKKNDLWSKNNISVTRSEDLFNNLKMKNVIRINDCFVNNFNKKGANIILKTNKKSINKIKFDKLILCCGTLGSTVLINKYLKFRFVKIRFYHTPMKRLVFLTSNPFSKFKEKISNKIIGLPNTMFEISFKKNKFKGALMNFEDLSNKIFNFSNNNFILNFFKKFFIVGNLFENDGFSKSYIYFKKDKIFIDGKYTERKKIIKMVKKILTNFFLRKKFIIFPFFGFRNVKLGLDSHYTSTLINLKLKINYLIDKKLKLKNSQNIYVMDNSISPRGLFFPTFTTLCLINEASKNDS